MIRRIRATARVLVDRLWPRGLSKESAALTLWGEAGRSAGTGRFAA
jgi:uncharacterized protein YeaO (DUF488 family)